MQFKTGAFRPGKPIQPVLIRYPNRLNTVTLDRSNPKLALWLTLSLSQPLTRMEIEFLPVYSPSIQEQSDARLFASNVNELIADKLALPVYKISAADALFPKKEL